MTHRFECTVRGRVPPAALLRGTTLGGSFMETRKEDVELFRALNVQETEERIQRGSSNLGQECESIFKYYCGDGSKGSTD